MSLEDMIEEARRVGERAFPDGMDFAVCCWPTGTTHGRNKWAATLNFRVNTTAWQEETDAGEGPTVLDAVEALVDLLEVLEERRKAG